MVFGNSETKLSLCLTKHHAMKTYWGSGSIASRIRDQHGGEWSASRPGRFTARERAPGIPRIIGWVGLTADLDMVVKKNIPSPRRESNPKTPERPARSLVAIPTELSRLFGNNDSERNAPKLRGC
jgi:hypothetical protein